MSNAKPETTGEKLLEIKRILGLTPSTAGRHARHNLDGAFIDIQHQDGFADAVCCNTIKRVMDQLSKVEDVLKDD